MTQINPDAWQRARRGFYLFMMACSAAVCVFAAGQLQGWWTLGEEVPVVRISGEISQRFSDPVAQALKTAFDSKAPGVILYIDSPGGLLNEAERIAHVLDAKKAETGKPVYAVCAAQCGSAAYLVAIHADEIYAGQYSFVGSIGSILRTWNASDTIGKLGVQYRAFTSGKFKAMLNPYLPVKAAEADKAQALVSSMGKVFAAEVQQRRAKQLKKGVDLFTGEVWGGDEARALGLVDGIATLDDVLHEKFGKATAREMNREKQIPFLLKAAVSWFAKGVAAEILGSAGSLNVE